MNPLLIGYYYLPFFLLDTFEEIYDSIIFTLHMSEILIFYFNIFAYRTLNNAVKHSIISYQTMQVAAMRFITQSRLPLSLSLVCRRCQLLQTIMRSSFHCRKVVPVANTTWTRWYSSSDQGEEPDFSPHSTRAKANLTLPDQARVVICGGGVIGLSVAYHLAEKGWTDVVVLEQGR